VFAQSPGGKDTISIIPQPVSVFLQKGYFLLKPQMVVISADKNAADVADFLSELIHHNYGYSYNSSQGNVLSSSINTKAGIALNINKNVNTSIGEEGYTLKVTTKKIILSANTPKGHF
jgi:hexosaminidase